jgi:hypothetical protein
MCEVCETCVMFDMCQMYEVCEMCCMCEATSVRQSAELGVCVSCSFSPTAGALNPWPPGTLRWRLQVGVTGFEQVMRHEVCGVGSASA